VLKKIKNGVVFVHYIQIILLGVLATGLGDRDADGAGPKLAREMKAQWSVIGSGCVRLGWWRKKCARTAAVRRLVR
jgi:hypothetical protein